MSAPPDARRVAFYAGGFEAVGGIEAFLADLLTTLPAGNAERSLLVWAKDLPEFRAIEAAGTRVLRTQLRSGCRFGLPDALLFARFGRTLRKADRIVFTKAPPAAIFNRIVRIARAHRPEPAETIFVTPYRPREMWPDGLPDHLLRGFDRFLVQSHEFTADLRAMGFKGAIDLATYIPPIASATPRERSREGPFRLGFLGRFVPQKNLFYLLDIVGALQPGPVELHLFGGGDDDTALRIKAAEQRLPVVFHGVVSRAAVADAIDSCDAFINPSISEGQCLVALEVLSRGRPFIATAVGAIPEILAKGRFGETIPLGDAAGAARIVRRIMTEWYDGEWRARDIADVYASAYPRDEIIKSYQKLL